MFKESCHDKKITNFREMSYYINISERELLKYRGAKHPNSKSIIYLYTFVPSQ
jgi:hypothetical protein